MDCQNSRGYALMDQRGSVLVIGLVLVFVLTLVGIGLFQAATIETRNVQLTGRDVQAFYAADTGVSRAAVDMADPGAPPAIGTLCFDTPDHNPNALCSTPVKPWLIANPTQTLTVYGTTCFSAVSCGSTSPRIPAYIVEATNHADADKFWLTATACIPGPASNPCPYTATASAQVKTLIQQISTAGSPTVPDAIFAASTTANPALKISSIGSLVDSFDSRKAGCTAPCSYASQTPGANGDVAANGGVDIKGTFKGDVFNYVNVSGPNPDVKIESGTTVSGSVTYAGAGSYSNSGTVTGGITQQASSPKTLQTLNNCGPYPASMDSFIKQYDGSGNVVPKSKWSYNSTTGALTISTVGPGWVTLMNGSYCLGSLVASGTSLIKINDPDNLNATDPTAATIITVNGKVDLSGGSFANTTNDAQNLQLISTYGNDAGETSTSNFSLSGGSGAYMVAYAPYTQVTISGAGAIYGAVMGNTIVASGSAKVHYDECLGRAGCATKLVVGLSSNPVNTYTLAQWRQSNCTQSSPSSPWSCS